MPFIKELVIHGFKSFARETKITFRNTINTIVGPNGSGKSNVTDAICFVLGRLGSKSMRAKKLSNLIFAGTESYKPAPEASVELIFDNTDKGFSLNEEEIRIKRTLRKNGQGIYKINDEIKTRQEILELLSQAGIDPNGFNIVLQGEIDSFVKMTPEQRREVLEEVAGIAIYEMRKQKSLAELEKTELRLKEANAILKERNAYLKNLEEERKQALHFKKLQDDVLIFKASINQKLISSKVERIEEINKSIEKEQQIISKINALIEKSQQEVIVLNEKINNITSNIQKSTGLEQEKLNSEIADLRADLAGMMIKKQSFESQLNDMAKRSEELNISIIDFEKEIQERNKTKGKSVSKELELKKKKLEEIEEQKRKLYTLKSNLSLFDAKIEEKQRQINKLRTEYEFNFSKITQMESEISIKDTLETHKEKVAIIKSKIDKLRSEVNELNKSKIENDKTVAILQREVENQGKVKSQVSKLDICPLCKTKITKEHIDHVIANANNEEDKCKNEIEKLKEEIKNSSSKIEENNKEINILEEEIKKRSQDILRLELINEKKDSLRKITEDLKILEKENQDFIKKRAGLDLEFSSIKSSEANSDTLRLEIQELERHNESNLGMEVALKQRDIERNKNILRQIIREREEISENLKAMNNSIEEKESILLDKNDQDLMLKEKFKKTLEEKNEYQEKIHFFERDLIHKQNEKHLSEEKINNYKIDRAQFLAQKEAIEQDSKDFKDIKTMRLSVEELEKRLHETQDLIARIGSVNLRALEVYENVKAEYDKIQEKVNKILEEKQEILNVIEEIDKKKKKAFLQTLEAVNLLFSRNFSQLSTKGIARLEITNPEDIFAGGIEMLIKVGKGKYFDTHSLSGGEQSLISLSLIFAIQEYKPYPFYIFDEIDAALDRRNSERLAALLKRYMNKGQYIIITHNDSLITESPVIYGVSMQEKISKVVSLEV